MEEEKLKECIEGLFNSITAKQKKESQELIKSSLEKLKESALRLSDPEHFNLYVVYKLNKGVREIANTMHEAPVKEIKDTDKPNFIFLHYSFLEHNICQLCVLREGSSCCADKSRSILKMYLKYSLTGEIPKFNPDEEHYYIPKFGNYEQWMALCDGLYSLYYGHTEKYFIAYNALIQAEIRKYKHILHTWYIRFSDGEVIKFNNSWDDKQENPLANEYFDKGDYYVIYKNYVKHRNYEAYEDEDFVRNYCKVPKTDISEIYKISEETMV